MEWDLDWSTALALAAVTVLEGFRRVTRGATIVGKVLTGPWVRDSETSTGGLRLVSWGSPFVLHLLIPPVDHTGAHPYFRRRWRRTRLWLPLLRALAALQWLLLVLGIPLAMTQWGPAGLVLGLFAVLQGALLLVILATCTLEEVGLPKPQIVRAVRGLLSPFAAPRAAEIVAEASLAGAPPLEALRLLLPSAAYSALLRPLVYDVKHRGLDPTHLSHVPKRVIESALENPMDLKGTSFCPRCGQTYRPLTGVCQDCDGVQLVVPNEH